MSSYGQFCAVARTHEVLGGRWTLLVVRELLMGSRRFNDIRRGIPRISRTVLSERLQALVEVGAVRRSDGPEYELTDAGRELLDIVAALGTWGQRWLPRHPDTEDIDLEPVLVDIARRARLAVLPREPLVVRIEIRGHRPRFLLLRAGEASLCAKNPGFPEPLRLHGPLSALVAWWRGDAAFADARRLGLGIDGPAALARAFPGWFDRYLFAAVPSAHPQPVP